MTGTSKVTALKPRGSRADGFDADANRRRRMAFNAGGVIALLAFALIVVALLSLFTVPQTSQALIVRLGDPVRTISEPGLHMKIPFIDSVIYVDNRILDLESGAVARIAQAYELPFVVVRAICDPAERDLPPAALVALDPDGEIGLLPVMRSLMRQPGQIIELLTLARDAALARRALVRVSKHFAAP